MSAYATRKQSSSKLTGRRPLTKSGRSLPAHLVECGCDVPSRANDPQALLDLLVREIADRVATALAARITAPAELPAEWLDSRAAASYLGVHRDTLRKLAAERAIPAEQDGPGCKLFYRRDDLDEWRRSGGRAAGLAHTIVSRAA